MIRLLDTKVSLLAVLLMFDPVGGSNVRVAPLTKLLPLIVNVWLLPEAGMEVGETLVIEGAAAAAVTVKEDETAKSFVVIVWTRSSLLSATTQA